MIHKNAAFLSQLANTGRFGEGNPHWVDLQSHMDFVNNLLLGQSPAKAGDERSE